ncbi:ubiquitin-specific protease ubp15 [Asimina triloba]
MLKPREADIPALFLVLVVLPLVTYVLLGKWNEAAKKKARINALTQLAADETFSVEEIPTAVITSLVQPVKTTIHECARCFRPATTRCSRCKSARYCISLVDMLPTLAVGKKSTNCCLERREGRCRAPLVEAEEAGDGGDADRRPSIVEMGCSCQEVMLSASGKNRRSDDTVGKDVADAPAAVDAWIDLIGFGHKNRAMMMLLSRSEMGANRDLGLARRCRHAGRPGSSDQVLVSGGFAGDEGDACCYCRDGEDVTVAGWDSPEMGELVVAVDLSGLDL